jgi:L-amino acid N-acyltransferase YncA
MRTPDTIRKIFAKDYIQFVKSVLSRIPGAPFEISQSYVLQASGPLKNLHGESNCAVRNASVDDLEIISRCQDKKEKFQSRFRKGDDCIIALSDGNILGFLWYSTHRVYIEEKTGYRLSIPEDAVYTYDEYVLPEFRKRGILNQLFRFQGDWMISNGKKDTIVMIEHDNKTSLEAHARKGFLKTKKVLYIKVFSGKYYLETAIRGKI